MYFSNLFAPTLRVVLQKEIVSHQLLLELVIQKSSSVCIYIFWPGGCFRKFLIESEEMNKAVAGNLNADYTTGRDLVRSRWHVYGDGYFTKDRYGRDFV